MRQLADDVFHLPLAPRDGLNAYLIGDVLVDAGLRVHGGRVVRGLVGYPVRTHVLTHAHLDHAGGSRRVASELGLPVWAGAEDADDVRSGTPKVAVDGPAGRIAQTLTSFPGVAVDRELREGDEVGPGFVVLDTPGHTNGHISLWRESDRTLVCGDVVNTMHLFTTKPGLHEPLASSSMDPARDRESIRRIAALEPALLLAGHGPVVRDPTALAALAASLPED
jgi:hydroxyacylglutathione hydrolase